MPNASPASAYNANATSPSEASGGARPASSKSSGSSARSIPELYEERGAHSLREFSLRQLRGATADFSPLLMVGEGGFGCVYRGAVRLPGGHPHGTAVAVKRLNPKGGQVSIDPSTLCEMQCNSTTDSVCRCCCSGTQGMAGSF